MRNKLLISDRKYLRRDAQTKIEKPKTQTEAYPSLDTF